MNRNGFIYSLYSRFLFLSDSSAAHFDSCEPKWAVANLYQLIDKPLTGAWMILAVWCNLIEGAKNGIQECGCGSTVFTQARSEVVWVVLSSTQIAGDSTNGLAQANAVVLFVSAAHAGKNTTDRKNDFKAWGEQQSTVHEITAISDSRLAWGAFRIKYDGHSLRSTVCAHSQVSTGWNEMVMAASSFHSCRCQAVPLRRDPTNSAKPDQKVRSGQSVVKNWHLENSWRFHNTSSSASDKFSFVYHQNFL